MTSTSNCALTPKGELYGHVTGFFSFIYGNEGLEKQYNDELTGRKFELTQVGDLLTEQVRSNNITVTIQDGVQQAAKDAMGNNRGAVVAIEPDTGAILAMYSNPSYDPNPLASHDFKAAAQYRTQLLADKSRPLLPRTYRESYPPGSTFKVVTAAAALAAPGGLDRKRYPAATSFTPPQTNQTLRNFGGGTCGGPLPDLLRVSCNTGFAQLGLDIGAERMNKQAEAFGFNSVPPLDMPSVARSRFPEVESFRRNLPFLAYGSIGQGNVSSTPLQMALVAAGVANGGVVMEPHLLKEVRNNNGEVVRTPRNDPWREATTPSQAQDLARMMRAVVENGTATTARINGVTVAGKTGTAQTIGNRVNTWFISFAPVDDSKIAVAVVVEDKEGVSEATGGRIAAPIAQQVMRAALGAS